MPKCRSCSAEIKWLLTAKGKNMPVDVIPVKVKLDNGNTFDAYESHFSTCPNADQHRKYEPIVRPMQAEDDLPF